MKDSLYIKKLLNSLYVDVKKNESEFILKEFKLFNENVKTFHKINVKNIKPLTSITPIIDFHKLKLTTNDTLSKKKLVKEINKYSKINNCE